VLALLAEGHPNNQIANRLGLTARTVKTDVKKLLEKLDASNRTHLVVVAHRRGLRDLGSVDDAHPQRDLSWLTSREREVLALLAEGHPNNQIANRLGVSQQTVKVYVRKLLGKLGARDRTHLAVVAHERGLRDLGSVDDADPSGGAGRG
jgi:DNA-binding NarL/FixJ family response regulator